MPRFIATNSDFTMALREKSSDHEIFCRTKEQDVKVRQAIR